MGGWRASSDSSPDDSRRNRGLFTNASSDGCLGRALEMFGKEPQKWREVSVKNTGLGFSWVVSVQSYLDLYNSIAAIQNRRNADYQNLSVRGWTIAAVAVSDIGMLMAFLVLRWNNVDLEIIAITDLSCNNSACGIFYGACFQWRYNMVRSPWTVAYAE